jgi:hypothetical protein
MRLAIMQPYIFPYIGYFQLINAADTFLIYDDVNFIKQGWINRNRILMNGAPMFFTLGLKGASSFKKICETEIGDNQKKLLKTIDQAYKKAPFFDSVYPLVEDILSQNEKNLSRFVVYSILSIVRYLGIETPIEISSQKGFFPEIGSWERVLAICGAYQATEYINASGGKELYSKEIFAERGIDLHFLKTEKIAYRQFAPTFVPNLSIIDVLMHTPPGTVREFLRQYSLE